MEIKNQVTIRKSLLYLVLLILLLTSTLSFANIKDNKDSTKNEFLNNAYLISSDFFDWNNSTVFIEQPLYSKKLKNVAILYTRNHGDQSDGYFIYDLSLNKIVEFAIGNSPYSNNEQLMKQLSSKASGSEKYQEYNIYGGPSFYGCAIKSTNGVTIYSELSQIGSKSYVEENLQSNILAAVIEKYLSGIYDFTWYNGCSPTAATNLVYYWSTIGYPKLTSGMSSNQVNDNIASFMGTNLSTGGTNVTRIGPGLVSYVKSKGYSNFITSDVTYPSFANIKTEIDSGRPGLITLISDPTYTDHTVTLAGYSDEWNYDYIIIHDTWSSTPKKVYHYYQSAWVKYLHRFYK